MASAAKFVAQVWLKAANYPARRNLYLQQWGPAADGMGTMEGGYGFTREDGSHFPAYIDRFYLVSDQVAA